MVVFAFDVRILRFTDFVESEEENLKPKTDKKPSGPGPSENPEEPVSPEGEEPGEKPEE